MNRAQSYFIWILWVFSKSVFDNIKSYLIEEKKYMDREDVSSNVSIADRIWKCLPCKIECQIITVSQ